MAIPYINTEAVENEVGGLEGHLGVPTSPLCDAFKRQRTFSDVSTEPSTPSGSNMSPTSTMASSPRLGSMSPLFGMSSPASPCLGHVLPEVEQFQPPGMSSGKLPTILSQSNLAMFCEPDSDDENPLALAFFSILPYSPEAKEEEEEEKNDHGSKKEVDEEEDEQETKYVEKDGINWVVTRGSPPTMSKLEDQLADVKALFKAKFGEDVDDEDEEDEDEQETVEKDGIKWVVTRGSPPTMSQLEDRLGDVKALYKAKFGEDVDDEDEEDEDEQETVEKDGINWVVTRGSPPSMSQLEDKLAEVKALYAKKFGESVDDDE
jgi:hypothetical protein